MSRRTQKADLIFLKGRYRSPPSHALPLVLDGKPGPTRFDIKKAAGSLGLTRQALTYYVAICPSDRWRGTVTLGLPR